MSRQSEAISRYLEEKNIKLCDAAEALHMSSPNLSTLLSGRKPFGKKIARRLHDVYNFNMDFLITGEGELLPSPGRRISVNQENVSVGGDNIIASTTTTNNTTNQTTEGSDTSMLKKMCHDLLERVMELEQENCALRCKLNSQKHE